MTLMARVGLIMKRTCWLRSLVLVWCVVTTYMSDGISHGNLGRNPLSCAIVCVCVCSVWARSGKMWTCLVPMGQVAFGSWCLLQSLP
eukprot:3179810-Amphidinium_carterae.2